MINVGVAPVASIFSGARPVSAVYVGPDLIWSQGIGPVTPVSMPTVLGFRQAAYNEAQMTFVRGGIASASLFEGTVPDPDPDPDPGPNPSFDPSFLDFYNDMTVPPVGATLPNMVSGGPSAEICNGAQTEVTSNGKALRCVAASIQGLRCAISGSPEGVTIGGRIHYRGAAGSTSSFIRLCAMTRADTMATNTTGTGALIYRTANTRLEFFRGGGTKAFAAVPSGPFNFAMVFTPTRQSLWIDDQKVHEGSLDPSSVPNLTRLLWGRDAPETLGAADLDIYGVFYALGALSDADIMATLASFGG